MKDWSNDSSVYEDFEDFYRSFYKANNTDSELASLNSDSAIACEVKHEDKLIEEVLRVMVKKGLYFFMQKLVYILNFVCIVTILYL